ncbi:hypothetical protein Lepto7375DRAFT_0614 [Leptolyngbya sp. PCC 7375]|nr:hypothetical protein Lepto7375DRAFT_0614 [Leptolyngbya sp. PCC 7375]
MSGVYPQDPRQRLGGAIDRFILDRSLWPKSLQRYFDELDQKDRSRGLTIEYLLKWMSEQTGIVDLDSPHYARLLGHYRRWGRGVERGGDSFVLLTALAQCGIVCKGDGTPIKDPAELIAFLYGRIQ